MLEGIRSCSARMKSILHQHSNNVTKEYIDSFFGNGDFNKKILLKFSGYKKGSQSILCTRLILGFFFFFLLYIAAHLYNCITFFSTFRVHSSPHSIESGLTLFSQITSKLANQANKKLDQPTCNLATIVKRRPTNTNQYPSSSNPLWFLQI